MLGFLGEVWWAIEGCVPLLTGGELDNVLGSRLLGFALNDASLFPVSKLGDLTIP